MALIKKTNKQKQEQAEEQDSLSFAFERTLQRKLNALVRVITDEFQALYSATGELVNADNYSDELQALLTQNYRRVNREFSSTYLNDLEEAKARAKTDEQKDKYQILINNRIEIERAIVATLLVWSRETAPVQTSYITDTWNNIIKKNTDDVIAQNILTDKPIDDVIIARQTKKSLLDEMITHNEIIAMQEVNLPSGNAKFVEVDEFNKKLLNEPRIENQVDKHWITQGDLNVREAHKAANGQKRDLNDPFMVGGELLRYPRDTQLGASLGNVINCRCRSIYT